MSNMRHGDTQLEQIREQLRRDLETPIEELVDVWKHFQTIPVHYKMFHGEQS